MKQYKEFLADINEAVLPYDAAKIRARTAELITQRKAKEEADYAKKPKPAAPVEKSHEELKQEHDKLSKQLDHDYRKSDDYSFVQDQVSKHARVAELKRKLNL